MKYCNKCGAELIGEVNFCRKCGNKMESKKNAKGKRSKENISNNEDSILAEKQCPQCNFSSLEKLKQGFFSSTQYYLCRECGYEGPLLLKTSYKITLTVITILVSFTILSMILGEGGTVGWLGIIAVIAFINDYKYRRIVSNYRAANNLPKYEDDEKNGLIKGVLYSVVVVIIVFALSSILE